MFATSAAWESSSERRRVSSWSRVLNFCSRSAWRERSSPMVVCFPLPRVKTVSSGKFFLSWRISFNTLGIRGLPHCGGRWTGHGAAHSRVSSGHGIRRDRTGTEGASSHCGHYVLSFTEGVDGFADCFHGGSETVGSLWDTHSVLRDEGDDFLLHRLEFFQACFGIGSSELTQLLSDRVSCRGGIEAGGSHGSTHRVSPGASKGHPLAGGEHRIGGGCHF